MTDNFDWEAFWRAANYKSVVEAYTSQAEYLRSRGNHSEASKYMKMAKIVEGFDRK